MKKIIFIIAFITLFGLFPKHAFAASESAGVSASLKPIESTKAQKDKRVEALERVFEKNHSPLTPYAAYYVQSADKYGVDWKLLPAISGLESGFGKAMIDGTYNAYGWGSGRIYFTSWQDGIDTINKGLAERYYARGADTVWEIGPIYAESPTWAVRVNNFMNQINAEYVEKATDTLAITI
jgi:hypothetical protein